MSETRPKLIVLDLDGTSARYVPRFELDPAVRSTLADIRARFPDTVWVLNSDRFEGEMIRVAEYLEPEEQPAAILSCQHLVYLRNAAGGYLPHSTWNDRHRGLHRQLWQKIYPFFDDWQRQLRRQHPVHELFVCDRYFAFRVPPENLSTLRQEICGLVAPWPAARVSGNHEWVFVVHESFSKGRLVQEFAAGAGIVVDRILTIGDGFNDLPMLDRSVARFTGCPGDAASEVRKAVGDAGGHVASAHGAAGTVEILTALFAGVASL